MTIEPRQIHQVAGIPTTSPVRTVADLALASDRFTAVSVIDSALNRRFLTEQDILCLPTLLRRRRGAVAARKHLAEADARAESPLETRLRLRAVDGRVGPDDLQHVVRDDDGYVLGVGDLAWRWARLIGEADGAGPHTLPEALYRDRRRQNLLANAGWTVLRRRR